MSGLNALTTNHGSPATKSPDCPERRPQSLIALGKITGAGAVAHPEVSEVGNIVAEHTGVIGFPAEIGQATNPAWPS
jgi:hypothetical protein